MGRERENGVRVWSALQCKGRKEEGGRERIGRMGGDQSREIYPKKEGVWKSGAGVRMGFQLR